MVDYIICSVHIICVACTFYVACILYMLREFYIYIYIYIYESYIYTVHATYILYRLYIFKWLELYLWFGLPNHALLVIIEYSHRNRIRAFVESTRMWLNQQFFSWFCSKLFERTIVCLTMPCWIQQKSLNSTSPVCNVPKQCEFTISCLIVFHVQY